MVKDTIAAVIGWAESRGWTVNTDSSGCVRFYDPQGNYIAYCPSTAKNSCRRW